MTELVQVSGITQSTSILLEAKLKPSGRAALRIQVFIQSYFHDNFLTYLIKSLFNIFIIPHYFLARMEELIFIIRKTNVNWHRYA